MGKKKLSQNVLLFLRFRCAEALTGVFGDHFNRDVAMAERLCKEADASDPLKEPVKEALDALRTI